MNDIYNHLKRINFTNAPKAAYSRPRSPNYGGGPQIFAVSQGAQLETIRAISLRVDGLTFPGYPKCQELFE